MSVETDTLRRIESLGQQLCAELQGLHPEAFDVDTLGQARTSSQRLRGVLDAFDIDLVAGRESSDRQAAAVGSMRR